MEMRGRSTLAFILPSFVMVLGLSALYLRLGGLRWMHERRRRPRPRGTQPPPCGERVESVAGRAWPCYSHRMQDLATVERVPLVKGDDEVIRVGGTRVTLETLVMAFDAGATPEEIAQDYSALRLDDIYAVITYYLRHTDEVAAYVERRRAAADQVRAEITRAQDQTRLRQRLRARLGR